MLLQASMGKLEVPPPPWKNVKNSAATMGHPPRSQWRDVRWEHKLLVVGGNWPSATGTGCSADLWAKGEQ